MEWFGPQTSARAAVAQRVQLLNFTHWKFQQVEKPKTDHQEKTTAVLKPLQSTCTVDRPQRVSASEALQRISEWVRNLRASLRMSKRLNNDLWKHFK